MSSSTHANRVCPLCEAKDGKRYVLRVDRGAVVRCGRCKMLFLDSPQSEVNWKQPPDYLQYHVDHRDELIAHEAGAARAALDALDAEHSRVLEVGIGVGAVAAEAKRRGLDYWCVEPSAPMVDAAVREGLVKNDHALIGPLEEVVLPSRQFDAIVMLMVLEHLLDPLGALRKCCRALKPGGEIFLEVPNSRLFRVRAALRRSFGMTSFMDGHVNFFTPATLNTGLEQAGFESPETRIVSNAARGDAEITVAYYKESQHILKLLYWALSLVPLDEWFGVASVLVGMGRRPRANRERQAANPSTTSETANTDLERSISDQFLGFGSLGAIVASSGKDENQDPERSGLTSDAPTTAPG